jgi:hypothetical protein
MQCHTGSLKRKAHQPLPSTHTLKAMLFKGRKPLRDSHPYFNKFYSYRMSRRGRLVVANGCINDCKWIQGTFLGQQKCPKTK